MLGKIYGGREHDWFADGRRGEVGKVSPLTQRIESCTTDLEFDLDMLACTLYNGLVPAPPPTLDFSTVHRSQCIVSAPLY